MRHFRTLSAMTLSVCLLTFAADAQHDADATNTNLQTDPRAIQVMLSPNAQVLSNFIGLGIQFDPYRDAPSPERWQIIKERVVWAHPGFLRVISPAEDFFLGFDTQGKPIFVWQHPTPASEQRLHNLLAILDFAQQHDISVYLGESRPPRALGFDSVTDTRWPAIVADFMDYLIHVRHDKVIQHYIFFNEPDGPWEWPDSAPDFDAWSKGIRNLRRDLDAHSLQQIAITGPDNSSMPDAPGEINLTWLDRSVKMLHEEFGSWEMHLYPTDAQIFGGEVETILKQAKQTILNNDPNGGRKELFLAESGLLTGKIDALDQQPRVHTFSYGVEMADYVAQVVAAGWMGADAFHLDDAKLSNSNKPKLWGFWDSSPESDMAIRPWFYTWSLMSRLFPDGARMVTVGSTPVSSRFRAVAAHWTNGVGVQTTVMLVNDSDTPRTVELSLQGLKGNALTVYHYFADDRPVNMKGFPVPVAVLSVKRKGSPLMLRLPSAGVIFVTTVPPTT